MSSLCVAKCVSELLKYSEENKSISNLLNLGLGSLKGAIIS